MLKYFDISGKNDYRSKWHLLLWSVLPLFIICYLLAFKKTFRTISEFHNNKEKAQLSLLRKDSVAIYDLKLAAVNGWKKKYTLDSTVMDAQVIATMNLSCNELGLNFKEYKPLGLSAQNVWTRRVVVQGDFKSVLKLIYELEQVNKICRIASLDFQKKKTERGEDFELNCAFYVQNVIKK
ncbi:MAG TPA: hypothetical protein PKE30_15205 [Niabella sp.]|nr:hypothetical protein [Niabella sp.]